MPAKTEKKTPQVRTSREDDQIVEVTLVVLPGIVQKVAVQAGKTVQDAADAIGADTSGYSVRINGNDRQLDTVVNQADYIVLAPDVEGSRC